MIGCCRRDWMCPACQHLNFKKRDSCQRCSCPKLATEADIASFAANNVRTDQVLPGDWYCCALSCGAHNFASRATCYRCGGSKDYCGYGAAEVIMTSSGAEAIPGWKNGDWICTRFGCGQHNYACRIECYKCKTPRDHCGEAE